MASSTRAAAALRRGRQPDHVQLLAPRIGVVYDLTGAGKTVLKFNYGTFWWNPGTAISEAVNENPADWFRRYNWADTNGNGV